MEKKQYPPNREYELTCFLCQKKGHKAFACPLKNTNENNLYTNENNLYQRKSVKKMRLRKSGSTKTPNVVHGTINDFPTVFVIDSGADISVFNSQFISEDQYMGQMLQATGFDGSTKEYPEAAVTCNVNGNTFTLRGLILDMDGREGGLLGLDLDTDTLKELLDLAKQTALHTETKTAVKLTRAEARRVEQEE